jgi:hypothetical protein
MARDSCTRKGSGKTGWIGATSLDEAAVGGRIATLGAAMVMAQKHDLKSMIQKHDLSA